MQIAAILILHNISHTSILGFIYLIIQNSFLDSRIQSEKNNQCRETSHNTCLLKAVFLGLRLLYHIIMRRKGIVNLRICYLK